MPAFAAPVSEPLACLKIAYESEAAALTASPHHHAYRCVVCARWHTTKGRLDTRRGAKLQRKIER